VIYYSQVETEGHLTIEVPFAFGWYLTGWQAQKYPAHAAQDAERRAQYHAGSDQPH